MCARYAAARTLGIVGRTPVSRGGAPTHPSPRPMLDLLYVAGSVGFFALMLAYTAGCARLGAPSQERGDER